MAPLPRRRVGTTMRAFPKCCVDYASPFTTKITRRVSTERYLCLFTCSATRAVHLEMACSLSTTDFLYAFSRMVATRGRPEEETSDNWTNFVGAERELRELVQAMDQEQIAGNVANNGLRWNWNPLLGSHFGGVFESLPKVAKKTLKSRAFCSVFIARTSPYNIHALSSKQVMRIPKCIRYKLISWSKTKFSQLIYKEMFSS